MKRPSFLMGMSALLVLAAPTAAGCGVGSGGPESKISKTTDTYLRSLSSGDSTKACAQLTRAAENELGTSCETAMERIATAVGRQRLADAADRGSSISVDGASGSATLKGFHDIRINLVESGSTWRIKSGYELAGGA